MNPFSFVRPRDVAEAVREGSAVGAKYIAGGTNLVDLMKVGAETPARLVDITRLPLDLIEELDDGGMRIGALLRNSDAAKDARICESYPLLSSALLAGASQQLRNAATIGGNLMQRTRCYYFYDGATSCNKREPGSGCGAIGGVNRIHAILGASDKCIATHPSDMCVALAALNARVRLIGPNGDRIVAISDFHRLPGENPERDTHIAAGELITSVELPAERFTRHYSYLKLRDRLSYAFALVSVAAALRIENDAITDARVALGGVAHKPWRDRDAEKSLLGAAPTEAAFVAAANTILRDARGQGGNDFKIRLAKLAIVRSLKQAANGIHQSQTDKRIA
jgi:xanthine dehydrogenase YagS FAD-binding subunit